MAKKKKRKGHYCRICGEYKANEKFSGNGHAQHICKACMSRKKNGIEIVSEEVKPEIVSYDLDDIEYDMFDPDIDVMPSFLEPIPYKKLDNDTKDALKELWADYIEEYWKEEHLIPLDQDFNILVDEMTDVFEEAENTILKVDKNLRRILHDNMLIIINKLLEAEHSKQKE
ncbi:MULTISPECIES: hypothetical protein [Bacteroidales]|uniref:hypothetical protein n=1 Tax=Bacteroidales TaxID=171549 RepID=UPI00259702F4|nr:MULTISPECIES: hypothetical protein [Bacteroidales]